jgi:hypothetical protein
MKHVRDVSAWRSQRTVISVLVSAVPAIASSALARTVYGGRFGIGVLERNRRLGRRPDALLVGVTVAVTHPPT